MSCDDGNSCTVDACGGKAGCTHTNSDGAACTDGSVCTVDDTCQKGACIAGKPLSCDDGHVCTTDVCDAKYGCEKGILAGACGDSKLRPYSMLFRYTGESCAASKHSQGDKFVCSGDPKKAAKVRILAYGKGGAYSLDTPFLDVTVALGDNALISAAAANEIRLPSSLILDVVTLDGKVLQHLELHSSCSAPLGNGDQYGSLLLVELLSKNPAVNDAAQNGKACGGDKCATAGTCKNAECYGSKATKCDDKNSCTADSCAPTTGCVHTPATGACDDDDKCTDFDTCTGTSCVGKAKDCDDGDKCTVDSCDKKGKCNHEKQQKCGDKKDDDD